MIKKLLLFILILTAPVAFAQEGYVSPETYAVNEADLLDYTNVPPPPKPNVTSAEKPQKIKKHKEKKVKEEKTKPYKKGPIYHMAKWWTEQSYKYEDPSHGEKHEIKVKQRMEYEKRQNEIQQDKEN
jgi:hypothetical protein